MLSMVDNFLYIYYIYIYIYIYGCVCAHTVCVFVEQLSQYD